MIAVVPPHRSVFYTLCNVPAPSELSAARATTVLSQVAPRNPYSDSPTSKNNPLVVPGYPPYKRYQPYPHPQVLPSGKHSVVDKGKRKRVKRRRFRPQRINWSFGGGAVRSLIPVYVPHLQHGIRVVVTADLTLSIADYDVEMDEADHFLDLVDVEMVDDFLS